MAISPAFAQAPPDLPVIKLEQLAVPPQRPVTEPIARPSTQSELDGPRTVSLTIARPSPIAAVLQLLVRDTAFSTVVHSSIRGSFSGELRNLTLRQALEAVLFPAGLDYDLRGTIVRVFPLRPATRLYRVDLLAIRRSWQSRPAPGASLVTSIDSDPLEQLDEGVRMLLSSEGRHHLDRRAGIVHVTDFADRLDQIGVYLEAVQLRAMRQIRIDVQVLRVTRAAGAGPVSSPAVTADVKRFLGEIAATATVDTIASPRLLTLNNEPATMTVSSADGGERSLTVTPQVSADGFFQLHVLPRFVERSTADPARQALPALTESDSVVRVREGETVIVSGLPQTGDPNQRAEFLVLLTPTLVVPSMAAQAGQR